MSNKKKSENENQNQNSGIVLLGRLSSINRKFFHPKGKGHKPSRSKTMNILLELSIEPAWLKLIPSIYCHLSSCLLESKQNSVRPYLNSRYHLNDLRQRINQHGNN